MNHGDRRAGRLTGSVAKIVVRGTARAKNTLMRSLDNPRKFHSSKNTANMPAPLAWGHGEEDWLRSSFWEAHPEYEFMTGDDATFVDERSSLWSPPAVIPVNQLGKIGTSPDGVLLDKRGLPAALVELKNPYNPEALRQSVKGAWVRRWLDQLDWGMMVTGLPITWLVIGDRREPPGSPYRYKEFLISRDRKREEIMRKAAVEFISRWQFGIPYRETPVKDAVKFLLDLEQEDD